jgi:hypothetical protein
MGGMAVDGQKWTEELRVPFRHTGLLNPKFSAPQGLGQKLVLL